MTDQTPTPDLDDFRRAYAADNNEWWRTDCGHHMNLFDDACDQLDTARDWAAWFAAEKDHWVERLAMGFQPWGRRVSELEADLGEAQRTAAWFAAERDRISSGAKTLGSIVDRQCRDVLAATGMQHVIDEDGDGDWGLVWERLAEMGAEYAAAQSEIRALMAQTTVTGDTSDGYHTFDELYRYRMLYNAAAFNAWAVAGLYDVHKSIRHSDGEECFGGGWFVVYAQLPTGQISNHYEQADWDLFRVPERERGAEWDGHTPAQVAERLAAFLGLESAPSSPHAYVAVKRTNSPNADGPEWRDKAYVVPAGDPWEQREGLEQEGLEFLPIVGTDAGTRHAAQVGRCQATVAHPSNEHRNLLSCELPHGHAGMHHTTVPNPGYPAGTADWNDPAATDACRCHGFPVGSSAWKAMHVAPKPAVLREVDGDA